MIRKLTKSVTRENYGCLFHGSVCGAKILIRNQKNSLATLTCLNINLHYAYNMGMSQAEKVAIKNDPGVVQTLGGLEMKYKIALERYISPCRIYKWGKIKRGQVKMSSKAQEQKLKHSS